MKHTLLVLLMAFVFFSLHAQEENWDAYLAQYPKGPGSTVLDMELKNKAPFKDFPFLLKTGVSFKHCTDQGMNQQDLLYWPAIFHATATGPGTPAEN